MLKLIFQINLWGVNIDDKDLNVINIIRDKIASLSGSNPLKAYQFSDSDIESEEVKPNMQAGSGFYLEINFKDGGFRQYDVESGKLIGSSYSDDQKYLPNLE